MARSIRINYQSDDVVAYYGMFYTTQVANYRRNGE